MLRAIDGLGAVSLTDWWPVRGVVLAVTVLAVLLMLRFARRITSILLATVLVAGLVLGNLALAGNAYYGTYPTFSSYLAGSPVTDPVTPAGVPASGQTVPVVIDGERSGFAARPALVHLPRAWFAQPRPSLPVLVLLHGSPGTPQEWIEPGAAERVADAWADRNGGIAPIIVMPDTTGEAGFGVCADTATGAVETYLTADVPTFVQAEFSTLAPGAGWAVAGHSAGASCALTLALRHPALFPTVAAFGATSGGPDPDHDPAVLLAARPHPGVAAWFTDTEPPSGATATLLPLARLAGVSTCQVVRTGAAPGLATWSLALADALPWLAARAGQVPETPDMTAACAETGP
ncbi:MAG: alpha/beta hydrolase [Pseudonocardia sp.]